MKENDNPFAPFFKYSRKTWGLIVALLVLVTGSQILIDYFRGPRRSPLDRERMEFGILPVDTTRVDSVVQKYFPIQTGNEWTYGTKNRIVRVFVMGQKLIQNRTYYVLRTRDESWGKSTNIKELKSYTSWNYYRFDGRNDVWEFIPEDSTEVLKYGFSGVERAGEKLFRDRRVVMGIEKNPVRTSVGIFHSTCQFTFYPGTDREREEWFASGVGMVKALWKDDGIILLRGQVGKKLFFSVEPSVMKFE